MSVCEKDLTECTVQVILFPSFFNHFLLLGCTSCCSHHSGIPSDITRGVDRKINTYRNPHPKTPGENQISKTDG